MNIIFFIYDGNSQKNIVRCITSLRKYSDCEIFLYCNRVFDLNVTQCSLSDRWVGRRMTHRMELARDLPVATNDRVISCDTDVLFQGDPFEVFEEADFDLFYTSREYKCSSPVNAGVWGFVKNAESYALLEFMIAQALNPTWMPYLCIREKLNRIDRDREIDWWANQDLLSAIHEVNPPYGRTFDAGAKYNCCPKTGPHLPLSDNIIRNFTNKIGDPNYIIIHYKELEGRV